MYGGGCTTLGCSWLLAAVLFVFALGRALKMLYFDCSAGFLWVVIATILSLTFDLLVFNPCLQSLGP